MQKSKNRDLYIIIGIIIVLISAFQFGLFKAGFYTSVRQWNPDEIPVVNFATEINHIRSNINCGQPLEGNYFAAHLLAVRIDEATLNTYEFDNSTLIAYRPFQTSSSGSTLPEITNTETIDLGTPLQSNGQIRVVMNNPDGGTYSVMVLSAPLPTGFESAGSGCSVEYHLKFRVKSLIPTTTTIIPTIYLTGDIAEIDSTGTRIGGTSNATVKIYRNSDNVLENEVLSPNGYYSIGLLGGSYTGKATADGFSEDTKQFSLPSSGCCYSVNFNIMRLTTTTSTTLPTNDTTTTITSTTTTDTTTTLLDNQTSTTTLPGQTTTTIGTSTTIPDTPTTIPPFPDPECIPFIQEGISGKTINDPPVCQTNAIKTFLAVVVGITIIGYVYQAKVWGKRRKK